MSDKDWTEVLRKRLEQYEAPPTEAEADALWAGVMAGVQRRRTAESRRRRRRIWIPAAVAACALPLLFLLWVGPESSTPTASTGQLTTTVTAPTGRHQIPLLVEKKEKKKSTAPVEPAVPAVPAQVASTLSVRKMTETSLLAVTRPIPPLTTDAVEVGSVESQRSVLPAVVGPAPHRTDRLAKVRTSVISPDPRARAVTLLAANATGSSSSYSGIGSTFASQVGGIPFSSPKLQTDNDLVEGSDEAHEATMRLLNQMEETTTTVRQSPPLRLGLTLAYEVYPHLFVESGLLYTMQQVEVRQGSERFYTTDRLTTHRLGIPVTLRWDFAQVGQWRFATSGTVMVEKFVSNSLTRDYTMDNQSVSLSGRSDTDDPLRATLRLGLGVRYPITRHTELFLEPGVAYRLTEYSSLGEEKRFAPDATIGLTVIF